MLKQFFEFSRNQEYVKNVHMYHKSVSLALVI